MDSGKGITVRKITLLIFEHLPSFNTIPLNIQLTFYFIHLHLILCFIYLKLKLKIKYSTWRQSVRFQLVDFAGKQCFGGRLLNLNYEEKVKLNFDLLYVKKYLKCETESYIRVNLCLYFHELFVLQSLKGLKPRWSARYECSGDIKRYSL